jgi:EAL domain-containing protein (putative c-di-GMP-specific phosphodiesterase class I)
MDMMDDDNDAVIVRSIIDLSHNMGRTVTAEGVESKDIYDLLEILGCDMAQGYHVCEPLPADELFVWLLQSKWLMDKDMIKPYGASSHASP